MPGDDLQKAHLRFWRSLARLIPGGFGLLEALEIGAAGCTCGPLAQVLADVKARVQQGETLSGAMAKHPDSFASPIVGMVEAGERTGKLHTIAELIADGWEAGQWPMSAEREVGPDRPLSVAADTTIDEMVREGMAASASDLHVEPLEDGARIRGRVDGILREMKRLTHQQHTAVVARIKALAGLDVAERQRPQHGRLLLDLGDRSADLRVDVAPSVLGENMVVRILDKTSAPTDLNGLGMSDDQLDEIEQWRHRPNGIIMVTGPAGSGRSTTLYAMLARLNEPTVKVVTVESPVERVLAGISQLEVRVDVGMTYPAAVRAQLRQDPDVVMVGVLQDDETARIAVQAAMTGHLVLTTVHTTSAAAGLRRLVDLGVSPYLVNDTVIGVVSQRLVRVLCDNCKAARAPTDEELDDMALPFHVDAPTIFEPAGCDRCRGTGYRGRTGVFEVLKPTDKIRRALEQKYGASDLHQLAVETGMRTVRQHAIDKVGAGITSLAEALRMTKWG